MDITFPNVHFILNKSTKTNIRYLQYLHGNVHFLWSFFQFDGFTQVRQQTAAWRSEIITCWIYYSTRCRATYWWLEINYIFFVKSASNLSTILNPRYELCDNYWIFLPGYLILYNINSKKKINLTYFTITSWSDTFSNLVNALKWPKLWHVQLRVFIRILHKFDIKTWTLVHITIWSNYR